MRPMVSGPAHSVDLFEGYGAGNTNRMNQGHGARRGTMFRVPLCVSLALLTVAFAGCTGGGGDGDKASAIDSEAARVRAVLEGRQWNAQAQLLMLGSVETKMDPSEFLSDSDDSRDSWSGSASKFFLEEFLHGPDRNVGDGNADTWFAVFRAPGEDMYYVVAVDRNGDAEGREVVADEDDMMESLDPIGDYEIDSNSAVARASKKGGSQFLARMNAEDGGIFYALVGPSEQYSIMGMGEQGLWFVVASSGSMEPVMVFVDAKTGAAFMMEDFFRTAT